MHLCERGWTRMGADGRGWMCIEHAMEARTERKRGKRFCSLLFASQQSEAGEVCFALSNFTVLGSFDHVLIGFSLDRNATLPDLLLDQWTRGRGGCAPCAGRPGRASHPPPSLLLASPDRNATLLDLLLDQWTRGREIDGYIQL